MAFTTLGIEQVLAYQAMQWGGLGTTSLKGPNVFSFMGSLLSG